MRLFFRLLEGPEGLGKRFLGKAKWDMLTQKWEESDKSLESDRLLEDQIRAALSLSKAQKAATVLKWLAVTNSDPRPIVEKAGLPWHEDPETFITALVKYKEKHTSQYNNNLLMLQATMDQQNSGPEVAETEFNIDDAIAGLNLAGFTIPDPNKLTIGQFESMNKAINRNGERKN